jgi:PBP1b-binding outer membrane lipoprotein LpoB
MIRTATGAAALLGAWMMLGSGCTGETKRMDPDQMSDIEFGTGITSQDFRSISQRMARSLVQLPQIQNATTPPKIAFSQVINNSNDYIDGDAFLRKMRTELVKNAEGRMVFLDRAIIDEIERENRDKARGKRTASGEQIPLGADFFLTGAIDSIDRVAGAGRTQYLRLSFRLTDAGTAAVVWEDEYEIKKHSTTGVMYR